MHQGTRQKVAEYALDIWRHYEEGLPTDKGVYLTAISILSELESPQTLESVALALNLHPSTVSEYVNVLAENGVPINRDGTRTRGQTTGRKEAIFQLTPTA